MISFFYKGEREREREREREFEFTSCFRLNCRIRARFPVIGNMLAFLGDGGKGFLGGLLWEFKEGKGLENISNISIL